MEITGVNIMVLVFLFIGVIKVLEFVIDYLIRRKRQMKKLLTATLLTLVAVR